MSIPTEPIGSVPRPRALIDGMQAYQAGAISDQELQGLYDSAVRETIHEFEATGSPVITDGEQTKPSFATYAIHGVPNIQAGGVTITFADGHTRQLPKLVAQPFRYGTYAASYLTEARKHATVPVKQAVISASAMSLLYPPEGIEGYGQEQFLNDLVDEVTTDIRRCLEAGAHSVQMDFTEGRLSVKLDPSKGLLRQFVDLNNRVFDRFSADERKKIGVHTCPGGDQDSTHSADVDYAELLPDLFNLLAGNFYVQLASEPDRAATLQIIADHMRPDQRVFVGVIDPIDPTIESVEQVCERVLEAADYVPLDQLGTTDDCGFSPFGDDVSTARETAFAKIRARVEGTNMAAQQLGR